MLLISRNSGDREFADPSRAIDANVNLTSSAVSSDPLWKRMPLRRWNFQVRPPSRTSHRSASMGMRLPLASRDKRFSHRGLSTTSSAPTYRFGSQRSLPKVATATVRVPSGGAACPGATGSAESDAVAIKVVMRRAPRKPCLLTGLPSPETETLRLWSGGERKVGRDDRRSGRATLARRETASMRPAPPDKTRGPDRPQDDAPSAQAGQSANQ